MPVSLPVDFSKFMKKAGPAKAKKVLAEAEKFAADKVVIPSKELLIKLGAVDKLPVAASSEE